MMKSSNTTARFASERRPMFTRNWSISKRATEWLVAHGVAPNAISLVGMAGGILAGVALAATSLPGLASVMYLVGVAGIVVRGMGNLLDGMVAVSSGKASPLGELFNEVPDRVSDAAILIGAGYGAGSNATLGLLAALVAVFVAYIRAEGKVVGGSQHYCGPMAKPERMLIILLAAMYCGLTPTEWQPTLTVGAQAFGLMAIALSMIIAGGVVTAVRRCIRVATDAAKSCAHSG